MTFKVENRVVGLPPTGNFQQGRSDRDDNAVIERSLTLPWASDPAGSYIYYECAIGVMLDSGIVVHNRLPQVNRLPDSLASTFLDSPDLDRLTTKGVNLSCNDQYTDIVQRMGHSRYWFRIWGQALRIGYQVPIPGIKTIGGVPAIPYDANPQWAFNAIAPGGNYGGIVLWRAQWSLWYTIATPPVNQTIPAADPSAHISGDAARSDNVQSPWSQADDNAVLGAIIFPGKAVGDIAR